MAAADRSELLGWFFDQAFRHRPSMRFHDVEEFRIALRYVAGGAELPISAILAAGNHRLGGTADIKARENFPQLRDMLADLAKKAGKAVHAEMTHVRTHTIAGTVNNSGFDTNWYVEYGIGIAEQPALRAVLRVWVFFEDEKFKILVSPPEGGPSYVQFDTTVFEPAVPPDFADRLSRALAVEFARVLDQAE